MLSTRVHTLKLNVCYADAVLSGQKTFEIRRNDDRGFQTGDRVEFVVVNNDGIRITHKLNNELFEITYVLPYYGLKDNFVAFAIKKI